MSIIPKLFLGGSIVGVSYLIYHVHLSQKEEIARLHEGVIRDQERQRYKKAKLENQEKLKSDNST